MIDNAHRTAPILYLADLSGRAAGEVAALDRDEARHVRALRLGAADPVRVTDGLGALWAARLDGAGRSVHLLTALPAPRPLGIELWAPIGNKQATLWLVEKSAEFGLRRLCPVECERSQSVADAGRSEAFWDKASRRALAAVKQSGSARAPEVAPVAPLADRLAAIGGPGLRVVLDPAGPPLVKVLAAGPPEPEPVVLVGPEGGLAPAEISMAEGVGFRRASLGPTILRFETAAVAALAVAAQLAPGAHTDMRGADDDE